ncbi:MAG: hypothetical protein E7013_06455 [Alphaproteobacteria bacterium]|nr:hypothetical protein [Alphaproteobacteria bacterium]
MLDVKDSFEKEHMKDAQQWADDITKLYKVRAQKNPNGWHSKFLKMHRGSIPVINRTGSIKIVSFFEKTINVRKVEEEALKILERW